MSEIMECRFVGQHIFALVSGFAYFLFVVK